jgi:hypothetical protein
MIYEMKTIMKRAHTIKKTSNLTFAKALKASWAIEKKEIALRNEWYKHESGTVTFKIWARGDMVRAYYTCSWFSNYANNKATNFISL